MTAPAIADTFVVECAKNPDRWIDAPDDTCKAICRACPRRWLCAKEAYETPGVEGMWAGVILPPDAGRARTFALRQLKSLAEHGGYSVRARKRRLPTTDEDDE